MTLIGARSFLVPAATLITLACSDSSGPGSDPIDALPRQLSTAEQKVIAGSNAFAFDLMKQVNSAERTKNVFISPLSASMALGMTLNGAIGFTYDEMHGALRLGSATRDEVNQGYKDLIALLRGLDKSTDFRIANSIWYEKSFPFHDTFLNESKSFFDAQVQGLDFGNQAASLQTINSWVNQNTQQKIPKILDVIRPDEVMFLINAIYFKSAWQGQFDRSKTADAPFRALDGTSANVPLMFREGPLRVAHTPTYSAVDLRYGNSAFSMTIVLPNAGADVNQVAEGLTPSSWASLEQSFAEREGMIYLPRFKVTWERKLKDDLKALGMTRVFNVADFTRMSPLGEELAISEVIQKTFVDVNEEGTEAAAVTSVGIMFVSGPPTFRVDRPFIFAIRERFSGTILFLGKIVKLPA